MVRKILFFVYSLWSFVSFSQGIKGVILDESNLEMPYASIYVKEKATGTTTNNDGYYELKLPPGTYHITYQFIGYGAQTKEVKITNDFLTINIKLRPQAFNANKHECRLLVKLRPQTFNAFQSVCAI